MSRDLSRHRCPVEGCKELLPHTKLMCPEHWQMVPPSTQKAVYHAYDYGAGLGTDELHHAQDAAIQAVERRLARRS